MKMLKTGISFTITIVVTLALYAFAQAESPLPVSTSREGIPWALTTSAKELAFENDSDETSLCGLAQGDARLDSFCCGDSVSQCCEHEHSLRFRLTEFNIYPTFSYRGSQSATYNEFEFASHTNWGGWQMENRTVLNVADLPSTIKLGSANPSTPDGDVGRASGFGDILSGFFFSRESEDTTHLGIGPVFTFPSATDPLLGSEQYTVGPGMHFSTEHGRLTAGFFLWQSWKFAGSDSQKRVNQLFGKPFFLYELNERWNLVYIPLGLSHSWEAKSGKDWTVPLGCGLRRLFYLGTQKMGFQTQVFSYVARKPADPEWEVRMTIEFLFDE